MPAVDTFKLLNAEAVGLSFHWKFYTSVYGNKKNVANMNQISGDAFGFMQRSMVTDIMRRICALTDPPQNGRNLVLRQVAAEWQAETQKTLPEPVENAIADAEKAIEGIRVHRNKLFAHFDLETKRQSGARLPKVLNSHIDEACRAIFRAMNRLSRLLDGSETGYELCILNNAEGKIQWMLTDVLRFRHLRKLAGDPAIPDAQIRAMLKRYSGNVAPPPTETDDDDD